MSNLGVGESSLHFCEPLNDVESIFAQVRLPGEIPNQMVVSNSYQDFTFIIIRHYFDNGEPLPNKLYYSSTFWDE